MYTCYTCLDGRLVEADEGEIHVFCRPDEAERQRLISGWGVGAHNLNSALDPDELARLESEEDHLVLILKRPRNYSKEDQLLFTVTSVGVFLWRNRIALVTSDEWDITEGKSTHKVYDPRDVLLRLLYAVISHFLGHLRVINMLSDSLEQRINTSMENRYLLNMFTLEKSLVYFLNGIGSNQMVLEKLKNQGARLGFDPEEIELLDDLLIENQQCNKQAEIYSNILTGLMDARGSIVNNNLNLLIKRLTILSVVFMPLNLLAGIGGMSEFSAWTSGWPWWISYAAFSLGLVGVGFLTYRLLRWTGLDPKSGR